MSSAFSSTAWQKIRGASWENYYRFDEQRNPYTTDRLMWRLNLTPTAEQSIALKGKGFTFDDVTSTSSHVNNPAPLNPPVIPIGPAGQDGQDGAKGDTGATGATGALARRVTPARLVALAPPARRVTTVPVVPTATNGKDGVNGTTTVIHDRGPIAGASMRTIHVRKINGMKFISARATLRGKLCRCTVGPSRSISVARLLVSTGCPSPPSSRPVARSTRFAPSGA